MRSALAIFALTGALVLSGTAALAADEDRYPARDVLGAFATACSGIEDLAVAQASVRAAQWRPLDADRAGRIGEIVERGAAEVWTEEGEEILVMDMYERELAGRSLQLVLSGIRIDTIETHGCRLYDLDAAAAIDAEILEEWAVRAPVQTTGLPDGITHHVWNPGLKPGHMQMEVAFVPANADLPGMPADIPLSGLIFTATALEFLDQ